MKSKILIVAALFSAVVMSANAGIRFGLSIGLPTVVVAAPPVYAAPVVYATPAPVVVTPAPVTVVESVPACPGVGYVWSPGYYSTGHIWVGGAWRYHPDHFRHDYNYRGHDGYRR